MSVPSKRLVESALFEDDAGTMVGLDEVQLLETHSADRVAILHAALRSQDLELRYRAALVLTAWEDDEGLDDIERLVDMRIDTKGVTVPHRLYGYNNIYDEFAYAVYLFGNANRRVPDQTRIYSKLLALYGPCDYESKLKHALLRFDCRILLPDLQQACQRAFAADKVYLASQLLPVLAKWDFDMALPLFPLFLHSSVLAPNPAVNVAEALKYVHSPSAYLLLKELVNHPDSVVADEAKHVISELER